MEITPVYLIIRYEGDPTVGLFSEKIFVRSPFSREDIKDGIFTKEDLDYFKEEIINIYKEFDYSGGAYDFEIEEQERKLMEHKT